MHTAYPFLMLTRALNDTTWKSQALQQALDRYGFTTAFGRGRRDEDNGWKW